MNLAILWDLLIQTTVKLWCTLSTHLWTHQPSDFQRTISEEFRSYTVNSLWDLIFKIKPTGVQVSLLSLIAKASSCYQKERRGTNLGKTHSCLLHPLCSFCSVSPLQPRGDGAAAQQPGALSFCTPTYCQTNPADLALQMSCFSEWGYWQGNERDSVLLNKAMGQFSEGRNYSAVGVEHNQNWPHRVNFARFALL